MLQNIAGNSSWKCQLGRSRMRWEYSVKRELRELCCEGSRDGTGSGLRPVAVFGSIRAQRFVSTTI
jgi:hypothetical protein